MNKLLIFISLISFSACSAQQVGHGTPIGKDSIAEKMLAYQLENGAWPKQLADKSPVNYDLPVSKAVLEKIKQTGIQHATIDNKATTREIRTLVEAYTATQNKNYLRAAERGISYLLSAQYDNGGFPQYFPNTSMYRGQITLNDNAMINALTILDLAGRGIEGFEHIRPELRRQARQAVAKGVRCLLQLQVKANGVYTIWAAQYDENTLQPAQARSFEPASLSTSESVAVIHFLMQQPYSHEITTSVHAAVRWLEDHDIEGYRFDAVKDSATGKYVRTLVPDSSAVIWARFYDLSNFKPVFGDRDNSVTYHFDELSEERKNGYAWFGTWPQKLIDREYPKWLKKQKNK